MSVSTLHQSPSVVTHGDHFLLRVPFNMKEAAKAIPGCRAKWDGEKFLGWSFPITSMAALAIAESFPSIDADDRFKKLLAEASKPILSHKHCDDPIGYELTPSWSHQRKGYWFIHRKSPGALLHWEMGCGKTKPVINFVTNQPDVKRVLICCPKAVVSVWPHQFKLHAGDGAARIFPLTSGSVADKVAEASARLVRAKDEPAVIIINYESAREPAFVKWAAAMKWDVMVADEIHRIKSASGRTSKAMELIGRSAKRRIGLTGTLMPHSPLDVFAQYRFLDASIFGYSVTAFKARYAIMGGWKNKQIVGWRNRDELQRKIHSIMYAVKCSEVLELPPVTHEYREVELSKSARRIYRELCDEFIAEVKGGVVTVSNALAKLTRLLQVTSGFLLVEREGVADRKLEVIDDAKASALADYFEDIPLHEPVVVFCLFRHDLDTIKHMAQNAGRDCLELSGRENQLADWQQRSTGDVLAVQIQAGSVGIDLTRARYGAYYSIGFNNGDYQQSLKRMDRPGQTRPVHFTHFVAKNTIDCTVYLAIDRRVDIIKSFIELALSKGTLDTEQVEDAT